MKRVVAAVEADGIRSANKIRELFLEIPEMTAIDQFAVRHDIAVGSINLCLNVLIRSPRIYKGDDVCQVSCRRCVSGSACSRNRKMRAPRHLARATTNKIFQSDWAAEGSAIAVGA